MSTIQPGTPVRVVIEGRAYEPYEVGDHILSLTTEQHEFNIFHPDPAVTVTPLDPERPTLDREMIARALFEVRDDEFDLNDWDDLDSTQKERWYCYADAILALIQAAHPEWTP